MFLFEEEKSSDFSGERKVKKKRSLQVQLHTKRTEVNKDLRIFFKCCT